MNKIIGIIQARMDSSRFPRKMSAALGGYTIIDWVIRRSKQSKLVHKLVLATSTKTENDYLVDRAKKYSINSYRGRENNVLSRFVEVADEEDADVIVRICADNPLICGEEIDRIVELFLKKKPDYAFNHIPALGNDYVDGVGAEVFSHHTLHNVHANAKNPEQREHVTKYIWDNIEDYWVETLPAPEGLNYTEVHLDVDTISDLTFLNKCLASLQSCSTPENLDVRELLRNIPTDQLKN